MRVCVCVCVCVVYMYSASTQHESDFLPHVCQCVGEYMRVCVCVCVCVVYMYSASTQHESDFLPHVCQCVGVGVGVGACVCMWVWVRECVCVLNPTVQNAISFVNKNHINQVIEVLQDRSTAALICTASVPALEVLQ